MSTFGSLAGVLFKRRSRDRFWEIDALRGVAIIMMVIFHLMWDLWFFRVLSDIVLYAGFWKYFQRTTANLFILLVGVSLTVSYNRAIAVQGTNAGLFARYARRGLGIFAWGMLISFILWGLQIGYLHFGVLHLIGFSIIAAYPFLRYRWLNLALWAVFNIAGYFLLTVRVDFLWLVWLGLEPLGYAPNDYFPIIPWFGVILLGVFIGNMVYCQEGRAIALPNLSHWLPVQFLQLLGRHSLTIYLLHQPLLFLLLFALGLVNVGL